MAGEVKEEFGEAASVHPGQRGQFEVLVDGQVIYSKAETQRFPEPGEVARRIQALVHPGCHTT